MVIPYGRQYTSTVSARAWIPVSCEHCGFLFAYLTTKKAQGEGSSLLWLDNEGAAERAQSAAMTSLDRAFKGANDPVPCPRCVRYQTKMVRSIRRGFVLKGVSIGGGVGLLWFVWTLVAWEPLRQTFWVAGLTQVPLLLALSAIGTVIWGFVKARTFDPDDDAQRHIRPPSGYAELTRDQFQQIAHVGYLVDR